MQLGQSRNNLRLFGGVVLKFRLIVCQVAKVDLVEFLVANASGAIDDELPVALADGPAFLPLPLHGFVAAGSVCVLDEGEDAVSVELDVLGEVEAAEGEDCGVPVHGGDGLVADLALGHGTRVAEDCGDSDASFEERAF